MNHTHAKVDLKLNLSPPRATFPRDEPSPPRREIIRSPTTSCVSQEPNPIDDRSFSDCPSSSETTSMMLVGCPRCLMYVMLAVNKPKCPKCKSTVLLDLFHEERIKNSK
ncbi:hypothetical protein MTR67_049364 [Solanum verrucosum]|uniref:GIR1-like zinc ribbon domain-containing protein n=1 Tax=Solanum verrucosum TaxID=315347 RepID=A0AAF0V2H5_SOLVR|nr:hypothetical protein MTR67_049364 [Solanum verrucosum]